VAVIGIAVGGSVIGLSHSYTESLFDQSVASSYWFAPAKFLASVLTAWSGVSAGMFIPMINIGGGLGASIAQLISTAFTPTLVAIGMVTFLAAVSRAPICSLFVILDLTGNYQLFIPLLVVSLTASTLSKFLGPDLWQTQTDMMLSKFSPQK
jgi:H+/Cl- antiporter ClcA